MVQLNAFRAIKAVHGKLPVNLIVVAEGDEERMSIGLRKFVKDHPELLEGADAMIRFGSQSPSGGGGYGGGSEGCVYVELTTSGTSWGRGPTVSDIHGSNKRGTDSPAWRHIKMLASLVSDDGNTPKIDGFTEGIEPLTPQQEESLQSAAKNTDLKVAAENLGVARFMYDDPYQVLKTQRYGTSFNLDGIWGGNMYAGGAGAILPNKITSKHNFRYVPKMTGPDIVKKLRAQLDKNGYKDVEVKMIGDVPWAKMNTDHEAGRALKRAYEIMNIAHGPLKPDWGIGGGGAAAGGYWPAYLFGNGEVSEKVSSFAGVPIVGGGGGYGGRAHAANEFYVIEGAGKVYGMAGAEKVVAAMAYAFAGKIPPAPAKSTN
jgi:acetylornithine deacetylase/succinyl-diaminopimelate desuccinylase-like protein